MSENNDDNRNFIEAKMIIQEFHDDSNVFVVGTAPFGKLWFDHEKVTKQYKVLTDSWYEEYGNQETKHSKRPRMVSVLIDESDPMFNSFRNNIREAQKQNSVVGDTDTFSQSDTIELSTSENVVVDTTSPSALDTSQPTISDPPTKEKKKRIYKKKKTEISSETDTTPSVVSVPENKPKPKKKKVVTKETDM